MLNLEVKKSIDESVLCWLATSSNSNFPNVSPKEVFTYYADSYIIIANIASPRSVKNIKENANVCVSFIDVFIQKGFQVKGTAEIITNSSPNFIDFEKKLLNITGGKFPFSEVIKIKVEHCKVIIAPKYMLYPETTEEQQIIDAIRTYKVKSLLKAENN